MARVRAPEIVVRIEPDKNPHTTRGYKWHTVERKKKRKTSCGIILHDDFHTWEAGRLSKIHNTKLCTACFRGLIIDD